MTIGIGAAGPSAGLAVWRALEYVERIGSGSIGGFATFATLDDDGNAAYYRTQRGGSATLFTAGDSVLDEPPETVATAPVAGVISSGPDRPEPLTQFLAARDGVGLATGHRLPNAPGHDGRALNEILIDRLEAGTSPETAVAEVTADHPAVDAGLIAVDTNGEVAAANTEKVAARPDESSASRHGETFAVDVLNNSITPGPVVSELAAHVAATTMAGDAGPDFYVRVSAGIEVERGDDNVVVVNEDDEAVALQTTDATLLDGERNGAVPYLGSTVVRDGDVVGETTSEANTVLRDGVVQRLSGKEAVSLGVRRNA